MSFPNFSIHPPKCVGFGSISCFELNNGKDQFEGFGLDRVDGRAGLPRTGVGSGHRSYGYWYAASSFKTLGSAKNNTRLCSATKQKFIKNNGFDFQLFRVSKPRVSKRIIEWKTDESGRLFSNAFELARVIQAELNQLANPHANSSADFGFDNVGAAKRLPPGACNTNYPGSPASPRNADCRGTGRRCN
jgi:hypothetical protein